MGWRPGCVPHILLSLRLVVGRLLLVLLRRWGVLLPLLVGRGRVVVVVRMGVPLLRGGVPLLGGRGPISGAEGLGVGVQLWAGGILVGRRVVRLYEGTTTFGDCSPIRSG